MEGKKAEIQQAYDNGDPLDYTKMRGYTARVKELLKKEELFHSDFSHFKQSEKDCVNAYIAYGRWHFRGKPIVALYYQMNGLAPEVMGEIITENEDVLIPQDIGSDIGKYCCPPQVQSISERTGIPIKHVKKYLEQFPETPGRPYMRKFKALESRVLSKVYTSAMEGDMQAAKLFLTVTGAIEQTPRTQTVHNTQNNFIQVNGNILSQNTIEQLPEAQQVQIWELVNSSLPQQKQLSKIKAGKNGTHK